ncbi:MAG: hypothetical protein QNJ98_04630, partial [Planctomycetota bacterium]|nr:hypothetical protein [Planctomycetota bacterium]
MVSPWISPRLCVLAGVLALGVALGACRAPRIVAGGPPVDTVPSAEDLSPPPDEVRVAPRTLPVAGNAVAIVEPGVYRADARFAALADGWSSHVAEAITLLDNRTGLDFQEGPPVRVVLVPLRDERVPHRIATRVARGRRQAIVRVNAEPIIAGIVRADTALVRALADAVYELVSLRHEPVPPWLVAFAGSVAAGDLELQLARVHRASILDADARPRVDPDREDAAFTTGLALLVLLQERALMDRAPDVLEFARQGEDPAWMLTRVLREPDASWIGPARNAFQARLRERDDAPYVRLRDAEQAWRETGRGGLEAALEPPVADAIAGEARVLRMRAAMEEGDWRAAAKLASGFTAAQEAGLRDPAALLALRAEIESRPGGDGDLAREWLRRLALDFPQSEARVALRDRFPLLGSGEDPLGWLTEVRRYIERRGTDELDLPTLSRILRILLMDHRSGAAARLVDQLGVRAEAPELETVVALVNEAEQEPTPAAIAASQRRLQAWLATPSPEGRTEVLDGGRAAWRPVLQRLPAATGPERRQLVQLLVAIGGASDTLRELAPAWRTTPAQAGADLDAIAADVDARVLRRVLGLLAPSMLAAPVVERLWFDVSFRIEPSWLDAHPDFLRGIRGGTYT